MIDDLLGLRVICTNLSDVFAFRDALAEYFPVEQFRGTVGDGRYPYAVEADSQRDYIAGTKPSGYRAFHSNLMTQVANGGNGWEVVRCELQVRTLLQDSWGELTHEDTYKPGGEVTEFVSTLSRRMAEVLAVMDGLAQDLRSELDRAITDSAESLESTSVGKQQPPSGGFNLDTEPGTGTDTQLYEAVADFVKSRFAQLQEPIPLAAFASEMLSEFGASLSKDWLGHRKMAPLLAEVLPAGAVVTSVPGMVVPQGYRVSDALSAGSAISRMSASDVPAIAKALKAFDASFPLLSSEQLLCAYSSLATARQELGASYGQPDTRFANMVTKRARDLAQENGHAISRGNLNYITMALLFSGDLGKDLSRAKVEEIYTKFVIERFARLGLIAASETNEQRALQRWLTTNDN